MQEAFEQQACHQILPQERSFRLGTINAYKETDKQANNRKLRRQNLSDKGARVNNMDSSGKGKDQKRTSAFKRAALEIEAQVPGNGKASDVVAPTQRALGALPQPAQGMQTLNAEDATRFMHLAASCAQITTHYELFQLVQGELQYFLPQVILLAAWGDFGVKDPQIDVISSLPGVRTDRLCDSIVPMTKRLHSIWIGGGSQAMMQDKTVTGRQVCTNTACNKPCLFPDMRFTLIHGTHNKRDGYDCLYIALRQNSAASDGDDARLLFLADAIVHQLDVAHRKVAALGATATPRDEPPCTMQLSVREGEITYWVAQGKTNSEIAQILGISVNTVKNHVHRIFDKLGASNRIQAVALYTHFGEGGDSSPVRGEPKSMPER